MWIHRCQDINFYFWNLNFRGRGGRGGSHFCLQNTCKVLMVPLIVFVLFRKLVKLRFSLLATRAMHYRYITVLTLTALSLFIV